MEVIETEIELVGDLPAYYKIAHALWGESSDFDSDGNSFDPESKSWNELTLILRSDQNQRIDIDPIEGKNKLLLKTTSIHLKEVVINYLRGYGSIK
jgi:hypothetical protein